MSKNLQISPNVKIGGGGHLGNLFALVVLLVFLPSIVLAQGLSAINPYTNLDWTNNQFKAALHVHTRNSSDAVNFLRDTLEEHYRKGFDIVAITDHNFLTRDWITASERLAYHRTTGQRTVTQPLVTQQDIDRWGMLMIPFANEQSRHEHLNTFFTNYNNPAGGTLQASLQAVQDQDGLSFINHPGRATGAHAAGHGVAGINISNNPTQVNKYADLFMRYSTCVGMEIINKRDNETQSDRILWDNILKQTIPEGRNVWGFSNDDSHFNGAIGFSFNMFVMPENTLEEFRNAMVSGNFYAVADTARRELGSQFRGADSGVAPPAITNIVADGNNNTITITAENFQKIEWISEGKVIATGNTIDLSSADVGSYVRANISGQGGIAFTQPIVTGKPRTTPLGDSQTIINGNVISNASYFTITGTVDGVTINSQHRVGNWLHDAYVMNNGTINGNTEILFGTLSNDGVINSATVLVAGRGELINHQTRTISNVTAEDGGYVHNEGTITTATVSGGILYNHRTNNATNRGIVGDATVSNDGWLNNSGGRITGTVMVDGGKLDNSISGITRGDINDAVIDSGLIQNHHADIGTLTMHGGTVANSDGGQINYLTFYGGIYDHNASTYTNTTSGTIGTLNLAGDSTGINWGFVDDLKFDDNGNGIIRISIAAFANDIANEAAGTMVFSTTSDESFGFEGIQVQNSIDFTNGNVVLDMSNIAGYTAEDVLASLFYGGGSLAAILGGIDVTEYTDGAGLASLQVINGIEYFFILNDGVFAVGWEMSNGFVTWDGVYIEWSIVPEPGTLAVLGLGLAGLGYVRRRNLRVATAA